MDTIAITATLDKDVLEHIYELTYKYGWIKNDESILGWLEEPAYKEKYRIEGELASYINTGLAELVNTYKQWLRVHTPKGWVEDWIDYVNDNFEDEEKVTQVFGRFDEIGYDYRKKIFEILEESQGGSRAMLDSEDEVALKEGYGEQFLEAYKAKLPEASRATVDAELATLEENNDSWKVPGLFIDQYELIEELKTWMIEDLGWNGADYLSEIYRPEDVASMYWPQIVPHLEELMKGAYETFLDHFEPGTRVQDKSLRENIEEIKQGLEYMEANLGGDLDQRVKTFNYGLTIAHHFGTMADHLIGQGAGSGKKLLDLLSSGPMAAEWDKELQKVLGHPRGSIRKEVEQQWYDPDTDQELQKLKSNQHLILAACLSYILYT